MTNQFLLGFGLCRPWVGWPSWFVQLNEIAAPTARAEAATCWWGKPEWLCLGWWRHSEHEHCKAQHPGCCCFCRQRFKKHSSSRILPGLCPLPKWSKVSLPVRPFLCKARMCWDSWKPNEAMEQWGKECRKGNTAYGIMCSCTKNLDLAIAAADSNVRGFVAVPRACEVSLLKAQSFLQSPFPLSELLGREAVSH